MDERNPIDAARFYDVPFATDTPQRILACRFLISREMADALVRVAQQSGQQLPDTIKGMLVAHCTSLGVLTTSPDERPR